MADLTYYNDQELPVATFDWANAGEDFSTDWTFSVRLARYTAPATTLLLKTTGITSSATTVTVAWSTTDWAGLEASTNGTLYLLYLYARRTADSKDMEFRPDQPIQLVLKAAPGTSAVSPSSYPITVTSASVTVADTAGYYTGTNVETVLAEVATEFTRTTRSNGHRLLPTGAIAVSMSRQFPRDVATGSLTNGQQSFWLVWLPTGTINTITFISSNTGATTPTNQWFSLYDASRNKLAVTADDTTTAWAANTAKTLTISGGYTITTEGYYYIGCMFAGTTAPQLAGTAMNQAILSAIPPIITGRDAANTGLTTPATAPATAAALTALTFNSYCYVS
jgi:hypothetical protein